MRTSADGTRLVYTVATSNEREAINGIWAANIDGTGARQTLGVSRRDGPPSLLDLSRDGSTALVSYSVAAAQLPDRPNYSYIALLDLKTGATTTLKVVAPGTKLTSPQGFYRLTNAVFSPDGTAVLYIYHAVLNAPDRVAVRGVADPHEWLLSPADQWQVRLLGSIEQGLGLAWVANGTAYVASSPYTGVLLRLSAH